MNEWLRSDDVLPYSVSFDDFRLMHRGMELKEPDSLTQADIVDDTKIFCILEFTKPSPAVNESTSKSIIDLVEIDNPMPKAPKEGYSTDPVWS